MAGKACRLGPSSAGTFPRPSYITPKRGLSRKGAREDAERLAGELAEVVLAEDRVVLAQAVRDGGPLRITRAVGLAELLVGSDGAKEDEDARAGEGA